MNGLYYEAMLELEGVKYFVVCSGDVRNVRHCEEQGNWKKLKN